MHNFTTKRRGAVAVFLVLVLLIGLVGCSQSASSASTAAAPPAASAASTATAATPDAPAAAQESWSLATASSGSNPYVLGGMFSQVINEHQDAVRLSAQVSTGWVANIPLVNSGEMQTGQITVGDLNEAYAGTGMFEEEGPFENLTGLLIYGFEPLAIVTLDGNLKSVTDLAGKKVHIGSPGSATASAATTVFAAYDMTEADYNVFQYTTQQAVDALKDGQIDAAFVFGVPPVSLLAELGVTQQMYIISLDDEHIAKVGELSGGALGKNVIKAGDYEGIDADVNTIDFRACLMANKDISEEGVYQMVKAMWENLAQLDSMHHGIDGGDYGMSLEKAINGIEAPIHPGAVRYYQEVGVL